MRSIVFCHTCRLHHHAPANTNEAQEFCQRHSGHALQIVPFDSGVLSREQAALVSTYPGNASVKEAFGTATTFTKTNANLASSATAGWQSNAIDNSSNLYLDALVTIELAAVNTAPANSKAIFLFAFGLLNTAASAYTSTGSATPSGSEGTLTFPDITTSAVIMPLLGVVPYPTQNIANNGGPFSVARCFGGRLPDKWGVAMVNHSGMTLSVTNIYYQELYYTVA